MTSACSFIFIVAAGSWNQRRPGFLDWLYSIWTGGGGDAALALIPVLVALLWWHFAGRYRRAEARRRRIESPRAKCFNCGYDLRHTRRRCPECGMPVTARPGQGLPGATGPYTSRDFYNRISDGSLWAIETINGMPVKALGPLPPELIKDDVKALDFEEATDAVKWDLNQYVRAREIDRRKLIHGIAGKDRGK